jgi:phosphomevalonate kinase
MTTFIAPGKVVLVGEYAVLDGAPAIALAVDRGVRCEVTPSESTRISTPSGDTRFVAPALAHATPAHYRFTVHNPAGLEAKPGFGGSAAACVCACLAAGRPASDAAAIHHQVQGGGSGIDIATSIHGGMIRFEAGNVQPLKPVVPVVIWSGSSAQTQPMVDRFLDWSSRTAFAEASRAIVDAFPEDPIAMLAENGHLLMDMATQTGLSYMTPVHASIRSLARRFGGAAKPSGAGGGDCAVALFPDQAATSDFIQAAESAGRKCIPIAVAGPAGPFLG